MGSFDVDGEEVDAPPAPDYDADPEEALDKGLVDRATWRKWPLWAKLRLLRRLRTEGAGRPEQYVDFLLQWYIWEMLGGRGSGKSDEAGRATVEEALRLERIRTALIARTFADVRDTMFEGETGLLAILPDSALKGGNRDKAYNRSLGELVLANGSRFKGFSSEKPNQLRGPQHHRAWIDEHSSWYDADEPNLDTPKGLAPSVDTTMSNLMLGLRLPPADGSGVRIVASSTPKPNELTDLVHDLAERRGVHRVLTTYANVANLDDQVRDVVLDMYEGTEVAAQELEGKILSAAKGAGWDAYEIEQALLRDVFGEVERRALGVDPAVSSGTTSDETGLVVVSLESWRQSNAKGPDTMEAGLCVEADLSRKVDVKQFGSAVLAAVEEHLVDVVCCEVNNGFDFVTNAIVAFLEQEGGTAVRRERRDRTSVRNRSRTYVEFVCETADGHSFVVKPVWQSVDKLTRAKAASVWWARGRARHAQVFEKLEKQMKTYDGSQKKSPDRLDGLTSAVAEFAGRRPKRSGGAGVPLAVGDVDPEDMTHPLLAGASSPAGAGYDRWREAVQ